MAIIKENMNELLTFLSSMDKKINSSSCQHNAFINNTCALCKKPKNKCENPTTIPLRYIGPKFSLTIETICRLRDRDFDTLLKHKKLHLVLDLDNTLIYVINVEKKNSRKDHKKNKSVNKDNDVDEILNGDWLAKLRAGAKDFLDEASNLFDMSIYTMAEQLYAREVARVLESKMDNKSFRLSRVISKGHGTKSDRKGLDVVLSNERVVRIVDDCEEVWGDEHKANLIKIKPYTYFNLKSPMEDDQELAKVLVVLRRVHNEFYDKKDRNYVGKDVRKLLEKVKDQ